MGALSHLRIVEIGSAAATSYCARLFADFGANVLKVEPPDGDPLRRTAPLTPKGQSAWFAFLNFNKSSVALDRKDPGATSRLTTLIEGCDILLDGRDVDAADCPAFDLAAIKRKHPGLIHVEAGWFGKQGPYANFAATDSTIRALTGLIKLVGPVEGPPMHAPDFQTGILAGLWGFIAAASSVLSRMQDGRGRASSLSIFESSIAVTEYIMFESFSRGDVMRRIGVNRFWPTFPVGIYETRQGWLGVTTVTPAQWRAFCEMLGLLDLRDDPSLFLGVDRLQHMEEIEAKFIPKLKQRTAQEWFAEGLRRKIPIVPVPEIGDLIADEEKKARRAIIPITIGDEAGFTAGSMQRLTGTPPRRSAAVPAIGERLLGSAHADEVEVRPSPEPRGANRLPLEGIRVVDFSMGWAGPVCTRTLADLGADVIKIEATQYPDWWRGVDRRAAYVSEQMYEKSVRYCIMNRNKRGITLDLTRPQGIDLAKRLLADADVVVDNYSVEVLPKLGLGHDVDVDVGIRRRQHFSGLPRLWFDLGAGLGPARRGRRRERPACHEPYRVRRCRRRLEWLRGGADRADPRQADRQGPVHRSRADRMHDTVSRALDHRPFGRRQAAREIRQPPSGFRAAWLLPLCRTGRLDRGRCFQ
jgi:crotonobetainyl-CoA:carnitine CoA-transferase CaiB-like acyl-CoA transferase